MKKTPCHPLLQITLLALLLATGNLAFAEVEIGELSYIDKSYMQQQRERVAQLSESNLGRKLKGTRDNDLDILQQLLDRKLVTGDQTLELQALGVDHGRPAGQKSMGLDWVIYEDKLGRSRALRYQTDRQLPVPHHHDFPTPGGRQYRNGGRDIPKSPGQHGGGHRTPAVPVSHLAFPLASV